MGRWAPTWIVQVAGVLLQRRPLRTGMLLLKWSLKAIASARASRGIVFAVFLAIQKNKFEVVPQSRGPFRTSVPDWWAGTLEAVLMYPLACGRRGGGESDTIACTVSFASRRPA